MLGKRVLTVTAALGLAVGLSGLAAPAAGAAAAAAAIPSGCPLGVRVGTVNANNVPLYQNDNFTDQTGTASKGDTFQFETGTIYNGTAEDYGADVTNGVDAVWIVASYLSNVRCYL